MTNSTDHTWHDRNVAFLGLGPMGAPMASNLIAAGVSLTVWNRTPEKCAPLVDAGAKSKRSVTDAIADADAILLSLANGSVVEAVLFESGAWQSLHKDSVVIDTSSIPPALAKEHAGRLAGRGVHHLDCPVSGGTVGAKQHTLAIMAGGPEWVFDRCRDLLAVLGNPVRVGESGTGQLSKLCNQVIVGVTVAAVSEAIMFARESGADPRAVREALMGGFADSRILREHGLRMIERNFEPGGSSRNQLKDLNTALAAARDGGLELPFATLARDLFTELCSTPEGAELDHTAVLTVLEKMNGKAAEK